MFKIIYPETTRRSFLRTTQMWLFTLMIVCGFSAFAQAQGVLCCRDNVLTNGDFESGNFTGNGSVSGCSTAGSYADDWCGVGSAQYLLNTGFGATAGFSMWGIGQTYSSGEGIYQAVNIGMGDTCHIRFDGRFGDQVPTGPDSVIVRFQAYTSAPTSVSGAGGTLIGDFVVKNTSYGTFTLAEWVAPAAFTHIMINPRNNAPMNDGALVSWIKLDNICMEVSPRMVNQQDPFDDARVIAYPHPAGEMVGLQYPVEWGQIKDLKIVDLQGRLITAPVLRKEVGEIHLNLEGLSAGLYLLNLAFENGPEKVVERIEKY